MITTIIIIAILTIMVSFFGYGAWTSLQWHKEHLGEEIITENEHFYARIFYYNPDDKRIFAPKRTGGGYTINFANPLSIITSILVIGGFVLLGFLA